MKPKLPPDSREFLALLNSHGVNYLIIGGWAVVWHGHVRTTGDLDILIERTPDNARRVAAAIEAFMPGVFGWKTADFMEDRKWFQMGVVPQRIDVLTAADGIEFSQAWPRRQEGDLDGVRVCFLGREDLLDSKRAADRDRDRDDLKTLERRPPPA
jgi:hypothetical protein